MLAQSCARSYPHRWRRLFSSGSTYLRPTVPVEMKHWIAGERVQSPKGRWIEKHYAATGEVLTGFHSAQCEEVDRAVTAATAAQEMWRDMAPIERGKILLRAADLMEKSHQELAVLETLDVSKPIAEALADTSGTDALRFYGGLASSLCVQGRQVPLGPKGFVYTRREPLGVCAGIGAWNYPLQGFCWKLAPALACGNALVFKPSELTPLTANRLVELLAEAGVPPGLVNLVFGGGETGSLLSSHPGVAKVSLTGSVPTGKRVMAAAAKDLKAVTLELGGKSPLIIFEDADIENAVSGAIMANWYTQGEVCSNGTRVFVHRNMQDKFLSSLLARTRKMKFGDPLAKDTTVGAMISRGHADKVKEYIEIGKKEGANVAYDDSSPTLPEDVRGGYWVGPVVFTDCEDTMRVVREEIFGMVMTVLTFDDEEEVIRRANDTEFGLAAGVFTEDIRRAHRVVSQLQAGTCYINDYNLAPPETPFGGYKQSGIGRECGIEAIEHYSQIKSIYVAGSDPWAPY